MKNAPLRRSLWLLAAATLVTLVAPWFAPHLPHEILADGSLGALPPSWAHPLGTDPLSRDVLSRLLHGARLSAGIALLAVTLALGLGAVVGAIAALAGRWVDVVLMRLTDALLAFPRVLSLLLLVASFPAPSPARLAVLIGVTGWMSTARLVRTETRRLMVSEHVRAAAALGLPPTRVLRRHLLPSLAPTLLAAGTIALAAAIPLEAALSFLGLGVAVPAPSLGNIIADAQGQILRLWWLVLFPVLAIIGSVFALNAVGESLLRAHRQGHE